MSKTRSLSRRGVLLGGTALFGLGALALRPAASIGGEGEAVPGTFEVAMSDEAWRQKLGDEVFAIMRRQGTEPPFTSPLLAEHRPGIFACAGCGLALFDSATKFESGTGWPSFYQALDNAVGELHDTSYGMVRTEIHCRRCGGHLGHLFPDGPPPTGLRYCMDGLALTFQPKAG